MKRIILLCAALVGSTSFAAQTPAQIEDLVKAGKYHEAETALVEVVKEHPESYKANYYLQQMYLKNGKLAEGAVAELKAAAIKDKLDTEYRTKVMSALGIFICAIAGIFLSILGYNVFQERKNEKIRVELRAKEKEEARRSLLTRSLQIKGDIEDGILVLKARNVKGRLMDEFQDLKQKSLDAIEILSERGDYLEVDIERFLEDAADGIRHVNRLYS